MGNKVQKYMEVFAITEGDSLAKVKQILMACSDDWEWVGSGSVIADLLDDKNITAQDVVELLQGAVEMGEGNREFKAAVTAMELSLKKAQKLEVVNDEDYEPFIDEVEYNDFQTNDIYPNFARAS